MLAGDASYADSGWRRALEIVQELTPYYMENPLGTSSAAAQAAFMSGTAAMYPATWILPEARTADINVGYMNFPTTDVEDAPGIWGSYGVSMGVNSSNDKADDAIKLLDYLFNDDVYVDYLAVMATFPVKEGVVVGDIDPLYPDMQASWEGKTFHAHLLPDDPAIQEALLPELQNLIGGKTDVDTVLAKLDVAAEEIRQNQ
jgi:ABC-type glycerol-3-phosphate transport system substrate-binding protein